MAQCCCNRSEENWYQHCCPFLLSSFSSKASGRQLWCDCAYWPRYISLRTLSRNRTVSAQQVSIYRLVSCDIRWWCHSWEEYLQLACTNHDWRSTVYYNVCEDLRSIYVKASLWILRLRMKAEHIILIRFFCRVEKCCCLQRANSRIPLRRESLRSSRCRLGGLCTSCLKSFQELRNMASHMQSSAFPQVCKYCSAQNLQFWLRFSSQSANFQA